ncbi:phosphoglycerate dehydrogenase [Mammaliicoccus sciuri]|uniref:phosphoglycerate dehydrogenase n=1 Tax=Mammaliicoccus sciuri TaxID=1296 RepID=UPI001953DB9F|nr:phosphoglycerate dehydrogenase [Mammaliicoccus sciuri]MCD8762611.1 phosphoglycerate dehydrogenase [Mammaliicoccus sciuri]MCJ1760084.1 phosphoglycerate dehydrogenase [Mammaliicoccus sciuri]MEB5677827.1 phosphoglycerate dehydrogenase [Mammaliicoccus sciuri]MEB6259377.1 phosphoglycerate dehydrogenase [Mammaliicoccus sciuri]MEB7397382.1 phosphoglycerate dehydrogenase [Mammaliicoccus sciuri]
MKVVTLMRLKEQEERLKETFPNVDFIFYKHPNEARDEDLEDVDILVSYHGEVNPSFLDKCKNIKLIAWFATGVNQLPLDYIQDRAIKLTNARGVHAIQIAEFIFAYILNDIKLFRTSYEFQKKREFNHKLKPDSINEKTILFLGTGKIPQRTAEVAKAFNMKVIGINTTGHEVPGFAEVYSIEERRHVYHKADFIVNVLPETEETIHLLQKEDFKQMNEDTHFINVGRGTVVSESVLYEALSSKDIRYASIDVFEEEPLPENSLLYDLDNVFITAHITGNDLNNLKRSTDILIENLKHIKNDASDKLINIVNAEAGY